jgi:hypothetical protein
MDFGIASVATSLANMETAQEISMGTMRRAIEQTEMIGEQLVQMMQAMAQITGEGLNVNLQA